MHPKLAQVVADFTALEKAGPVMACDDAFCCLGTTMKQAGSPENFRAVDHAAVLAFAWAARRNGAQRFFIVTSLGADSQSRLFCNQVKGETEDALMVMGFSTLGIFRPSLLLGSRRQRRWAEFFAKVVLWLLEPTLLGRLKQYRAIEATVVARAMVRCAMGRPGQGTLVYISDQIQELGGYSG